MIFYIAGITKHDIFCDFQDIIEKYVSSVYVVLLLLLSGQLFPSAEQITEYEMFLSLLLFVHHVLCNIYQGKMSRKY